MNFTILSDNDRLATLFRKPMKKIIPVLDCQQQLTTDLSDQIQITDDLRDKVELYHLQVLDLNDTNRILREENDVLRRNITGLQGNMAGHTTLVNDRNAAVARCTSMESQVRELQADVKTEVGNRDHFRALVAQQDAFIKEAKRQIEVFKADKNAEIKRKTEECEHLARQAVRLNEENSKLIKENVELKNTSDQLNTQTPLLMEENRKFREQTTRLLEENRKLFDKARDLECDGCKTGEQGAYCGGCLGCINRQAEHTINEMDEALTQTRKELDVFKKISSFHQTEEEVLKKALLDMMCLNDSVFKKNPAKHILFTNTLNTVAAIQGNIDNFLFIIQPKPQAQADKK